jgi:iron complex transport system ATP-binding protein
MHDLSAAARFAEKIALLDQGRVVETGEPDAVLTESVLSRFYRTAVQVLVGGDGRPVVVPLRR